MNPVYLEDGLRTRRERLLQEATTERLLSESHLDVPAPHDVLLARLGDLLLACGLRLQRHAAPAGALTHADTSQPVGVLTYRFAGNVWQQTFGALPAYGFHLLRYDGMPTIGLMYWRLDPSGTHEPHVPSSGEYAAITWLAAAAPSRHG